jgi:hypothetical protein
LVHWDENDDIKGMPWQGIVMGSLPASGSTLGKDMTIGDRPRFKDVSITFVLNVMRR